MLAKTRSFQPQEVDSIKAEIVNEFKVLSPQTVEEFEPESMPKGLLSVEYQEAEWTGKAGLPLIRKEPGVVPPLVLWVWPSRWGYQSLSNRGLVSCRCYEAEMR